MSIKYHFCGKDCSKSNLKNSLKEQGFTSENIVFLKQIHSKKTVVIDESSKIHDPENPPEADALITNLKNLNIGIYTADCAPILLFDKDAKVIAATHAGWRGAKSGVIAETILEMKKLGAKNISAIIGPMIQQESYEVSQEFFDDFLQDKSFFKKAKNPKKYLFNLPAYVENKLRQAGVLEIKNKKTDTYQEKEIFHSFRRSTHLNEKTCGRNISIISL